MLSAWPKKSSAQVMANKPLLAFLKLFLPLTLLVVFASWLYDQNQDERLLAKIRNQEALAVGLAGSSVQRDIQTIIGDLNFMAEHYALQKVVNDPASPESFRLEVNFTSLIKAKKFYDRVRWIDASGQEIVRAERINEEARLIAKDQLRNRSERYYFAEAMQVEAGSIYVSPLDLKAESGQIEIPFKPMLRLAMPLADKQGIKKGIVIINYLAEPMLHSFAAGTPNGATHISLLDGAGNWLHSPNVADEWGFMFNDATRTLANRFPATWAKMQGASGQFEDENGLWTYESIYPLNPGSDYRWLVVSHIEPSQLAASTANNELGYQTYSSLLLLVFGLGIFYFQRNRGEKEASEQRFRAVFDYAMVGIATTSPSKGWLTVNPALCRIFGYEEQALKQKTWAELTHQDDLSADIKQFEGVLRGESDGYSMEKRFIHKDGSVIHAFISARAVRATDGSIDYFVAIVEDVSNWVLAEQQWDASVDTLQRFIDHLPGMAYVKDAYNHLLVATHREKFLDDLSEQNRADEQRVLKTGITEVIASHLNGRFYESTKFVIPRQEGAADLGSITLDVTDRHQAQLKLAQQIRRSAVMLELPKKAEELPEQAFMKYALERAEELTESVISFMHFVNDDEATIELVAWSSNTLAKYCTAAFDNHYPITEAGIWADAAREKRPIVINDYATAPNKHGLPPGHSALLRLLSIPVMEAGKVRMMTGVGNKASDYSAFDVETVQLIGNEAWRIVRRNRAEKSLQQATQVVNASPVVCFRWAVSEGWPVTFVSENVNQWGYRAEDIMAGRPPYADLVHPDDLLHVADEVARNTASGVASYEQEYRLLTQKNEVIWVVDRTNVHRNAAGEPEYFDGVLTDITERKRQQLKLRETLAQQQSLNKRLEEANNQLLQSEKMASIGQLAAGVAHELNNPIGFVHSNLGTLDGYLHDLMTIIAAYEKAASDTGCSVEAVHRIRDECDYNFIKEDIFSLLSESKEGLGRVRKIVQDLKNFSRVGEQEWQEADLHQGLDSTLNIVWNELKYKCKVVKEYGDIPHIFCMISQLNQVFMNLLVNAGHAIETQGTITIRTSQASGNRVCIEISDTGKGIAPENITRIFEPFFTTKPVGKGTGLGLSLSYGIVQRHGGHIEVDSQLGIGSTFRVLLPIQPVSEQQKQDLEISS